MNPAVAQTMLKIADEYLRAARREAFRCDLELARINASMCVGTLQTIVGDPELGLFS